MSENSFAQKPSHCEPTAPHGCLPSHRQRSPHHMPHGPLQRLRSRAVPHREIHADLRDVDSTHGPAHRELLRISQGGRAPPHTDRRLAPSKRRYTPPPPVAERPAPHHRRLQWQQHRRLHIRVIPFIQQFTHQRVEAAVPAPECSQATASSRHFTGRSCCASGPGSQ